MYTLNASGPLVPCEGVQQQKVERVILNYIDFRIGSQILTRCMHLMNVQVLSPKDVRFLLLSTWLQPLVDDFAWMQRCCRNLDKKVVEEGISQTILTLPLKQQQSILLSWFDRFSSSGDDCPNLQKAFEVWWRRTFTRPSCVEDQVDTSSVPQSQSSF